MERRQNMTTVINVIFIILHFGGSLADKGQRKLSVLVGADVTLSCVFERQSKLVEWSSFTVEWNKVDQRAEKSTVYTLEDGRVTVNRHGCTVDKTWLLESDASLTLQNVTVGDEGLYTCRVITPVVHTETTALEVLARPLVSLPERVAVTEGEEKTVQCDIRGFYPEKLAVRWHIQDGSHVVPAGVSLLSRVCTEMATHNPDGTYSIRSGLTLHSSAVKGGETHIICQVEHQTYSSTYNRSVALTVQAPQQPLYSVKTLIIIACVIILLLVPVVTLASLFLYNYICKAPLYVSEFSKNTTVQADVQSELICTIEGARQRELVVKWFRVRVVAEPLPQAESDSLLAREELSEKASMLPDGRRHKSVLPVCLSVAEDLTKYQCEVHCRGKSVTRETVVQVKVEPSFLQICSSPHVPQQGSLLVLCCRVENFYPRNVHLEWSRTDGEQVQSITHFGPFSDRRGLYSMWSKIQRVVAIGDEGTTYTCRVYHSSFSAQGYKDVMYRISTEGTPPDVMFIECEPLCPHLDEECTLHLSIKDFCPEDVSVTWTKDGEPLQAGVFSTPPSLNINGRFSMFSFLKLTPSKDDQGSQFVCRVEHSAQREAEERVFTLPTLHPRDACDD